MKKVQHKEARKEENGSERKRNIRHLHARASKYTQQHACCAFMEHKLIQSNQFEFTYDASIVEAVLSILSSLLCTPKKMKERLWRRKANLRKLKRKSD